MNNSPCVLVAPLDWGLGHASRSIPIIDLLLHANVKVLIGASGRSLALLKDRYPTLPFVELPAYDVRYSTSNVQIPIILRQVPRLLRIIRQEHRLIQELVADNRIQGIISDNRYGAWSSSVPSAFICHQMSPLLPRWFRWLQGMILHAHLFAMRRFDRIWIPDQAGTNNLSGPLSHGYKLPKKANYIGALSRFSQIEEAVASYSYSELNDRIPDMAVILSGPEPQRSLLEEMILHQAKETKREVWVVGGKTESRDCICIGNICQISFMNTPDLHRLLCQANIVISRSGYSSLMDYQAMKLKQVILVPTPGQTEQEVLGDRLMKQQIAYVSRQQDFQMINALERVGEMVGFRQITGSDRLRDELHSFLEEME